MGRDGRAENSFRFAECLAILRMTGRRAADPQTLAKHISEVDEGVLFHHMHQYYLKEPIKAPEYSNDFARWAAESLEDRTLAEKLSGIDPYALGSIADVRRGLLDTLETYGKEYPPPRPALRGEEFFFNDAVTFVVPTAR